MYTLLMFYDMMPISVMYFLVFDKKGNLVAWFNDRGYFGLEQGRIDKNKYGIVALDFTITTLKTFEIEIPWEEVYRVYTAQISHTQLKRLRGCMLKTAKSSNVDLSRLWLES